jgi:hypothetical protein
VWPVCFYLVPRNFVFSVYEMYHTVKSFSLHDTEKHLWTVIIIADRSSNPFCLLNPDVRRMHTNVADDNVLLVSSKSDEPQQQRRFELKTPPPKLSLLSSKRPA